MYTLNNKKTFQSSCLLINIVLVQSGLYDTYSKKILQMELNAKAVFEAFDRLVKATMISIPEHSC